MKFLYLTGLLFLLSTNLMADWTNLNTGINDDLSGVVFSGQNGVASGKKGLYYTTTGGAGTGSWARFNINNNPFDSLIYNHTRFYHCYSYYANTIYACGQDTVSGKAIIMSLVLPALTYSIIYQGIPNSLLKKIGYDIVHSKYYAVGNHGLVVGFTASSGAIADTSVKYDLASICFVNSNFWVGANGILLLGKVDNTGYHYTTKNPTPSFNYKDVLSVYATGNGYFYLYGTTITENTNYDFGSLNGNCIKSTGTYNFVGTDHGIFRSTSSLNVLEWQPSSGKNIINNLWFDNSSPQSIYACGNNGTILVSTDLGGATKPYDNFTYTGGCKGAYLYITGTTGSSTTCSWYANNTNISSSCGNVNHIFNTAGNYSIKLITSNASGLGDTVIKNVCIVDYPEINKHVTVNKNILCHQEPIDITIDSSQLNVYYTLNKFGNTSSYGSSPPGNDTTLSYTSSPLSDKGNYYLQANSSLASCYKNFTDTIKINVEKTKANYHLGEINVTPNELLNLYQTCTDAQNYKWTFTPNAKDSVSNNPDPINGFNTIGETQVKLVSWSNNGCYDSIQGKGPTVYMESQNPDSCWVNVNNGVDPTWSGVYYPDIAQLSPSRSGYFTCGYFNDETFATQMGDSLPFKGAGGGYMLKHNFNGVLKWNVHTCQNTSTTEVVNSAIEDKVGNIYICGNSNGFFIDNKGDSTYIAENENSEYIIKLDSLGRKLWCMTSKYMFPYKLSIDKSNNLIVAAYITSTNIPVSLNGFISDTIAKKSPSTCNNSIIKISQNGKIIWDFGIYENTSESGVIKFGVDKFNNIYIAGDFSYNVTFYSVNNLTGYTLNCNSGNQGCMMFLVKYDSNGVFLWKQRSITDGPPQDGTSPFDMVTDDLGNSYISGKNACYSSGYNQVFENTDSTTTSNNVGEYFVAKVNSAGVCKWIQGDINSYYGYGDCITKKDNEISVLGKISNNSATPQTSDFTSSNNASITLTIDPSDYFIAVYDTLGNLLRIITNGVNGNKINTNGFSGLFRTNDLSYYVGSNIQFYNGCNNYMNFGTNIPSTNGIDGSVTKFKQGCGISYYPLITNVHSYNNSNSLGVYPNPFQDQLNLTGTEKLKNVSVQIINSLGKTVIQTNESRKINMGNLPPGLYIIMVFGNNELVYKEKLIKY